MDGIDDNAYRCIILGLKKAFTANVNKGVGV